MAVFHALYGNEQWMNEVEYDDYECDGIAVRNLALEALSDDELFALPAHLICESMQRASHGGLRVEDGDQVASVELIKRIQDTDFKPGDFFVKLDMNKTSTLPELENPYVNTTFSSRAIPPRVTRPRLPHTSEVADVGLSSEGGGLRGLTKCIWEGLAFVQNQQIWGGDVEFFAKLFASAFGLPVEFFLRPLLKDEADSHIGSWLASNNKIKYLTYMDPAWQAIVTAPHSSFATSGYGTRSIIHTTKLSLLARLQLILGHLASSSDDKPLIGLPMRVDADYVHHYQPDCLTIRCGEFPDDHEYRLRDPPFRIQELIERKCLPQLHCLLERLYSAKKGSIIRGFVPVLGMHPSIPREVERPSSADVRSAVERYRHVSGGHEVYQGISMENVAFRVFAGTLCTSMVPHLWVEASYSLMKFVGNDSEIVSAASRERRVQFETKLGQKLLVICAREDVRHLSIKLGSDMVRDRTVRFEELYDSLGEACLESDKPLAIRVMHYISSLAVRECFGNVESGRPRKLGKLGKRIKTLRKESRAHAKTGVLMIASDCKSMVGKKLLDVHIGIISCAHAYYGARHGAVREALGALYTYATSEAHNRRVSWCVGVAKFQQSVLGALRCELQEGGCKVSYRNDELRRCIIGLYASMNRSKKKLEGKLESIIATCLADASLDMKDWLGEESDFFEKSFASLVEWTDRKVAEQQEDHDLINAMELQISDGRVDTSAPELKPKRGLTKEGVKRDKAVPQDESLLEFLSSSVAGPPPVPKSENGIVYARLCARDCDDELADLIFGLDYTLYTGGQLAMFEDDWGRMGFSDAWKKLTQEEVEFL